MGDSIQDEMAVHGRYRRTLTAGPSLPCCLFLLDLLPDLLETGTGCGFGPKGAHDQPVRGTIEDLVDQPRDKSLFRHFSGNRGRVDVPASRPLSLDKPLFMHDLKKLEHSGIPNFPRFLMDVTHPAGPLLPEYLKNIQLTICGKGRLHREPPTWQKVRQRSYEDISAGRKCLSPKVLGTLAGHTDTSSTHARK